MSALGWFFGIGAVGRLASSGWVLALVALGVLSIGIEWVVASPTRVLVLGIIAMVVVWAPLAAWAATAVKALVRPDSAGGRELIGLAVAAVIASTVLSVVPMWALGYACSNSKRPPMGASCGFAEALPPYLVATQFTDFDVYQPWCKEIVGRKPRQLGYARRCEDVKSPNVWVNRP